VSGESGESTAAKRRNPKLNEGWEPQTVSPAQNRKIGSGMPITGAGDLREA